MYTHTNQTISKEISYSNQNIFQSSTSKRMNVTNHISSKQTPIQRNNQTYKYYIPSSSKGVSTSKFASPTSGKIVNISSSKSSVKNVPVNYSNGSYFKQKHISNRSPRQPITNNLTTISGSNNRKYSFQTKDNISIPSNSESSNRQLVVNSHILGDSLLRNKNVFSSNDHRQMFQKNTNLSKHHIHKNQFRPGGQNHIYKKRTHHVNNYNSNKNLYENLASNSYPKNITSQYQIQNIDPFKNEPRNRVNSIASPKYLTPQINSKKNLASRKNNSINQTPQFQLNNLPYNNVYQNKK